MVRWLLICFYLISYQSSAFQHYLTTHKCVIVYYLDGPAYAGFSLQVDAMQAQLQQQNIALVDLRHWRSTKPHIALSGRERRRLRQQLNIQHRVSHAVLLSRKKQNPEHFKGTVDLIDFLLACK